MKFQFDANQSFQLDAVASVTDLFDDQPQRAPEYAVISLGEMGGFFAGQDCTEVGVGNRLLLADHKLRANLGAVQTRNDIEVADPAVDTSLPAQAGAWEREIDERVSRLYGLTDEEVALVEGGGPR